MTKGNIELETVRDLLYSRIWVWRDLFLDAFFAVQDQDPTFLRPLSSATIAGLLCDQAYSAIVSNTVSDVGVKFGSYRGQKHFWVEDLVSLRIKKLNGNFLSSNYRTAQSSLWNAQSPLPGLSLGARLELGYQVDLTGSVLRGIFVLFRLKETAQWLWQIHGAQVTTFATQPTLGTQNSLRPARFLYEPNPRSW